MPTITHTDYLAQVSGSGLVALPGLWVRLRNNSTSTDYFSTAVSDAQGAFTHSAVPGDYSAYTGTAATVGGTPTLRNAHYAVPVTAGDDAVFGSGTIVVSSPYGGTAGPGGEDIAGLLRIGGPSPWIDITAALVKVGATTYTMGAVGDGVADNKTALTNAQAAQQASGGRVFVPPGKFLTSDYVDLGPGTSWCGVGVPAQIGTTNGSILTATGANKGVFRYRPGAIGSNVPVSGQNKVFVMDLLFDGGANTGHLCFFARFVSFTAVNCGFSDTAGTGLKDDLVTAIAAAAIYVFGCEIFRWFGCYFENNTNATGNGGAACMYEQSGHMQHFYACHFNGNVSAIRMIGTDCGSIQINGGQAIGGTQVIFSDSGGWYGITLEALWCEGQTATTGAIINSSGANLNQSLTVQGCNPLKGTGTQTAFSISNLDGADFKCNFYQTWANVYALSAGAGGGNWCDRGNTASGVTAWVTSGTALAAFAEATSPGFTGVISGATVSGVFRSPGRLARGVVTLTYSASMAIEPGLGDFFEVTVTNGTAFAFTIDANTFMAGQELTLMIFNNSGGVMGAVTFPGAFFADGSYAAPANGKRKTCSWYGSGNNYKQKGRWSQDM